MSVLVSVNTKPKNASKSASKNAALADNGSWFASAAAGAAPLKTARW